MGLRSPNLETHSILHPVTKVNRQIDTTTCMENYKTHNLRLGMWLLGSSLRQRIQDVTKTLSLLLKKALSVAQTIGKPCKYPARVK